MKQLMACGVAVVPLLLASCGGTGVSPSAPIDVRATLAIGQSVQADHSGLAVRFDAVPEDSRCPADAMCVTAGQATLRLTVTSAARQTEVHVQTDPPAARTARAEGLIIECVALDPYPWYSRPTQPGDYRATVRVRR